MITKISILRSNLSWEKQFRHQGNPHIAASLIEVMQQAEFYNRSASLISLLREFPNANIEQSINAYFPPGSFTINQKTKTERTYFVNGGLYIHETDKP
jgi:hypothetical protein